MITIERIFTLEEAERWFNIKQGHQNSIDRLSAIVESGVSDLAIDEPLSEERKQFLLERIAHCQYLLSDNVKLIDRIVAALKVVTCKMIVINYTIINNETDVIIACAYKPEPDKW